MKQKIISLFILVIFSICHYMTLLNSYPKEAEKTVFPKPVITTEARKDQPQIKLYGKYTCLMDPSTGRVLYGKNINEKAPMASTTKIMTCLLALEHGDIMQEVPVSQKAASMPKVHLGMKNGESYYMKDLLYSLMLMSHNDSAVAIAEAIGGSVPGFASLMNQRAKKIGMNNTNFVTPNGLDAKDHYSTAKDMCLLATEAMKSKEFREIITTTSYTVTELHSKKTTTIMNKDSFLSLYEGALGIKTGFTSRAGYCFVGAAKRNHITLVCSTLAAGWPPNKSHKWSDTSTLMNFGFQNYTLKNIPIQKLSSCKIPVEKGESSYVSCTDIASPVLPVSEFDKIQTEYIIPQKLTAPIKKTEKIGTVILRMNDKSIMELPVYPDKSIKKSTFRDKLSVIINKYSCVRL